jgi:diguanylate cyclase (GGDEF)-like protein
VSYRYGASDAADTHLIRGGLFLSLVSREGHVLGSLALFWRTPGYEPPVERIAAIEQIAATSIPAIENARRYREARQLAETDALTGFFNQRYFHETLRREALRAQRYDRRLALLIIDLDDFKAVNDRIGHLAGDAVLAQVAERLRNEIRSVDIGCRVGGDEFGVIMPESTSEDSSQLFQRMHDAVAAMPVPGGQRVRISAGIAELRHGETAAGLFERADSALYRAKEQGKDRANVATDS